MIAINMVTSPLASSLSQKAPRKTRARVGSEVATLADVAKAAGVAPMTVSRFLNHHPTVTEKTSKKVRAAIEKLGYAPNHAARMLMGQPSNVIGLIVPNLTDAFFAEVAHNVQETARLRGYLVWVAASNSDIKTEVQVINQMKQRRVDGILLIPASRSEEIYTAAGSPPIITVDRPVQNLSSVLVDNRRSSEQAVEHLIEHGYKRIACLGKDPGLFTIVERIAGYEDAMRRHGLRPQVMTGCEDRAATEQAVASLLAMDSPVQAIFTLNSPTTMHVLRTLDEMGVSVPKQVAVFGFDDFDLTDVMKPRVSVVRQPGGELGRCAAKLLFERLSSHETSSATTTMLSPSLIIRESCGCVRQAMKRDFAA